MNDAIEELRKRYSWPHPLPPTRGAMCGWFSPENRKAMLADTQKARVVVELGSFEGMSAKWFCEHSAAIVICVDHWEGSSEHHRREDWKAMLPTLYGTFIHNLKRWKDRVVPMKTTTLEGIAELASLGIVPDLVYVDAAHDEESVYQDVTAVLDTWPTAELYGDDWPHDSVRRGVVKAAARCPRLLVHGGDCWQIGKEGRSVP